MNNRAHIEAIYDYFDERKNLSYQVVRMNPKGFYQRRPDGKNGWINNLEGVKRILYKLPHVIEAIKNDEQIYIFEGEKDVDRAIRLGLAATTSAGGAKGWRDYLADDLANAHLIIIPDNDAAGEGYAQTIIASVKEKAADIKLVRLPGLAEKEDLSDWLDGGNGKEDLLRLVKSTPYYEDGGAADDDDDDDDDDDSMPLFPLTELGNAERLVYRYGKIVRYCHDAKSFLIYNGIRWEFDKENIIKRLAKKTVRKINLEIPANVTLAEMKAIKSWAKESETSRAINAMVELAKSFAEISIMRNDLDSDDWLLNVNNGTIELRTGQLREHRREDFISLLAPVDYDSEAKNEIFDKFLERILPDPELREFIQISMGYSISGSTSEEKLFFAYGPAATGKSTLFSAVKAVLNDYSATVDFETFLEKKGNSGGIRNDIARLAGKRLVLGSEVDEGRKLAEGVVKQMTGNDTITARFLYQENFEFQPKMKLWLAANFRPQVNASDGAMWRRILQAPFTVQIPTEERDPNIKKVLSDPKVGGPAILAWLVEGCLKWQQNGLKVPKIVEDFTNEYRQENDVLTPFLEDCCMIVAHLSCSNSNLWDEYLRWCRDSNEQNPLGRKKFTQALEARGFRQIRTSVTRVWTGIGLIAENSKSCTDIENLI